MQGMAVLSCWVLGALQGAILILVPTMMLQGGISAFALALPLSLGTFVFMCCSGWWGHLLDKRASANQSILVIVRWVLLGFLASQLSFIAFLQFSEFQGVNLVIALCLARVLHGLFCSAIIPSAQLTLSHNDKKGEKLVWSSIATNIGRLTAPLLTFVPIDINYFSLWFIASVTLVAALIAWFSHNADADVSTNAKEDQNPSYPLTTQEVSLDGLTQHTSPTSIGPVKTEVFSLVANPLLISVCIAAILITLFSSQLQFSLGPLLLVQFGSAELASNMTASLLFAASASALMSLFILYRPLSRSPILFIFVISASFIAGSLLFVMQKQLIVAVVLISAALSMAPAWYTALAIHASKYNKARTSAAVSQGHTLGNAFGGLAGGLLLILGQQALLLSFILLMVLILCAGGMVYHRSHRVNTTNKVSIAKP
ncbi:MFS transporter [Psychromonas sp. L1A2]|uniref:MFS transporter n=1 Tax=Psychromonas sp. L1A2 TaxID=2686356 RepID=UPI0013593D1B|nr:MFS transporter [Psychromonas sp. L1A2]